MGNGHSQTSGQSEFFESHSRYKKRVSVPVVLPTYEANRASLYNDSTGLGNENINTSRGLVAVPFSQGRRKPQPLKAGGLTLVSGDQDTEDISSAVSPSEADTELSARSSRLALEAPRILPEFELAFKMESFQKSMEQSFDSLGSDDRRLSEINRGGNEDILTTITPPESARVSTNSKPALATAGRQTPLEGSTSFNGKIILKNPAIMKLKKGHSKEMRSTGRLSGSGSQASFGSTPLLIPSGFSKPLHANNGIGHIKPLDAYSLHSIQSSELFHTETEKSTPIRPTASTMRTWKVMVPQQSTDSFESLRLREAMKPLPSERNGIRRPTESRAMAIAKFRMVKFNSTSTLFVDTTITNADLRESIRYTSLYLSSEIQKTILSGSIKSHDILNEELHPLSSQIQFFHRAPSPDEVFRFTECLFQSAELNVECVIITLVYIQRMIENTGTTLHTSNWARVILGAVVLASKVWDDHAVWNADYCQIFPEVDVTDLNELERFYLKSITFDVSVRASAYAKLYFDLREMADLSSRPWALKPLMKHDQDKLKPNGEQIPLKRDSETDSVKEQSDIMPSPTPQKLNLRLKRAERKMRKSFSDYVFVQPNAPAFVM